MQYSIGARPTLELFFTTTEGEILCVDEDGEIKSAPEEDLSALRWAPVASTDMNQDARDGIEMAQVYAADNGLRLEDLVYFN